jgi:carbonic anhydrase
MWAKQFANTNIAMNIKTKKNFVINNRYIHYFTHRRYSLTQCHFHPVQDHP